MSREATGAYRDKLGMLQRATAALCSSMKSAK